MRKFKTWDEVEKDFNFTKEEEEEMRIEMEIIKATIEARKDSKMTQTELSKKTGIKQPVIARFEKGIHSPSINTLVKILNPLGYTLKVVPIQNSKEIIKHNNKESNKEK